MDTQKFLEEEGKQIRKFPFLPHPYKKVGIIILILSVIGLPLSLLLASDKAAGWWLAVKGMVVGMLIISISKDREEDEYTMQLRAHSYSLAFIFGVIYALLQPYFNYWIATLVQGGETSFEELPVSAVLWFMLVIQLGFYTLLKATR